MRSGRACGSGVQRKERRVDRGAQQGSRRMFALEEGVSPGKGTVDAPPGCPALVGISRYCSSRSGASSQRLIPAQQGAQQVSSALFARPCPSSTCAGAPSSPGQLRGTRSSPTVPGSSRLPGHSCGKTAPYTWELHGGQVQERSTALPPGDSRAPQTPPSCHPSPRLRTKDAAGQAVALGGEAPDQGQGAVGSEQTQPEAGRWKTPLKNHNTHAKA